MVSTIVNCCLITKIINKILEKQKILYNNITH